MNEIREMPALLSGLRLLPYGMRCKARLARGLIRLMLDEGPAEIRVGKLTFRVPSTREPVAMGLIADGCYERDVCAVLATRLSPHSVFFDVGANVGVHTINAAHNWCSQGRVLGFEASPRIFSFLNYNVTRHQKKGLEVLHRAVTSKSGQQLTFYDAPLQKFGMGSLANRFQNNGVLVSTISLDDAASIGGIEHVDVIKVDVEGFELGVFQGAMKLLQQTPSPFIVFEFTDWAEANAQSKPGDAQRFLRSLGYQTLTIDQWRRGEHAVQPVIEKGGAALVAVRL